MNGFYEERQIYKILSHNHEIRGNLVEFREDDYEWILKISDLIYFPYHDF